jgi:hypothetical protein
VSIPKEIGPQLPGVGQALLAFGLPDPRVTAATPAGQTQAFTSDYVQVPFLPRGLIVWGATADTFVERVRVGNTNEVEVSGMAIPARYFETGRSFDQIARLAAAGELEGAVGAHQLLDMRETSPGVLCSVALRGPFESFCVWGNIYLQGTPYLRGSVERVEGDNRSQDSYRGVLQEVGLAGLRTVLDVSAPDSRTAAELLAALRQSRSF